MLQIDLFVSVSYLKFRIENPELSKIYINIHYHLKV